jgi:predicted porin
MDMLKKKLVLLTSIAVISKLASAQSSVTLYGVADDSLTYTNNQNGHAAYQTFSGGLAAASSAFWAGRIWAAALPRSSGSKAVST